MTDRLRLDDERDDHVAVALERTFATYAEQAPRAAGLPERVRRAQRRRVVARAGVGTGAALAVAAAIVVPMVLSGGSGDETEPAVLDHLVVVDQPPAVDPPEAGWRWESYGGVELQVPADWDRGTTGMPWCLEDGTEAGKPYVGRPQGAIPLILCRDAALSEMGDRYVWFGSIEPVGTVTDVGGWVRETRQIGDVVVSIKLDDAAMAERIFETARLVEGADWSGCPPDHPLAEATGDLRPAVPWEVADGVGVLGGSVCRYLLPDGFPSEEVAPSDPPPALSGSRRLSLADAIAIRDAVAAAPPGSGPNDPASCLPEVARGDEAMVVRLETDAGLREIFLRYDSCDHHGADDGTTLRQITPEIAASVFDAALLPTEWSGVMNDIFTPLLAAQER